MCKLHDVEVVWNGDSYVCVTDDEIHVIRKRA